MEFLTQFPVMERTALMELRKGIDLKNIEIFKIIERIQEITNCKINY